jgi:hypothetical protein
MMTAISERDILKTLMAIGCGAVSGGANAAAASALTGRLKNPMSAVDREGAADIGFAWLAGNKGATAPVLIRNLFPGGATKASVSALAVCVRSDYQMGKMFECEGWQMSDREGRLCAAFCLL